MKKKSEAASRLDAALVDRAVGALLKHHAETVAASDKTPLLGTAVPLQVLLGLEVAPGAARPKPICLPLPHPIHKLSGDDDNDDLEEPEVCLIVKEDAKPSVQEMIANFPEHLGCIKKVLGLQSLRNKHASYQQRRDLLARYNVFMADDRIIPMLQGALGRDFVRAKKLPIPVRITRQQALPLAVQKALQSTYLHINKGTCLLVQAGTTAMARAQLAENVLAVVQAAVPKVPRQWANLRSVSVKLPASQALPVYNKTPHELQAIAEMAGLPSAWRSVEQVAADKAAKQQQQRAKETEAAEKTSSKGTTEKSPLLRALKKQKKLQSSSSDATKDDDKEAKQQTKEAKNRPAAPSSETKNVDESHKKKKKHSHKRKKKGEEEEPETVAEEEPKSSSKKSKKEPKSAVVTKNDGDDEASPAKKQKKEAPAMTKTTKEDDDNNKNSNFIAARKFQGSKKGHVFKMDKLGLGYYVDVKPVPDRLALEALARMSSNNKRGKKSSGGGKRSNKRGRR